MKLSSVTIYKILLIGIDPEYILGKGEKVFLVGEDDILGAWNPLSAVALSCVKDRKLWQTSVLLNKG